MDPKIKKLLAPIASLRLTVVLIALSMLLIYAGTWAQIDTSVWEVQHRYFHSLFTWIDLKTFLPRPAAGQSPIPGGFPMPGGYLIGVLLLLNLIAAHLVRFKLAWKRTGIILIHLGLILLLVGEGLTSKLAAEGQMTIDEGGTSNYSQDVRQAELAIIDPAPKDHDDVAVIPASRLHDGAVIQSNDLPVNIRIDQYFANSGFLGPMQARQRDDLPPARATAGAGVGITVVNTPRIAGTEEGVDAPSAYVTLTRNGNTLGTYLVSTTTPDMPGRRLDLPQQFTVNGTPYLIQLRFKRYYKPYSITLLNFTHARYLGTDVPKDFSSHVRLVDPTNSVDREVRIWMNHPLRYNGETFYQSGFLKGRQTTILQIVRNPSWTLPYIACIIGGLGLVIHFSIKLVTFLKKQATTKASQALTGDTPVRENNRYTLQPHRRWTSAAFLFPLAITALCAFDVIGHIRAHPSSTPYDRDAFAQLPVSHEGRVQPLDSLARNSMKMLFGRESFYLNGQRTPAIQWLLDLWADRSSAENYEVFRIDFPDLLDFLELQPKSKTTFQQITGIGGASPYRFSWKELEPKFAKLQPEFAKLDPNGEKHYTLFQRRLAELSHKLNLYITLADVGQLHMVPPSSGAGAGGDWNTIAAATGNAQSIESLPPTVRNFLTVLDDYNSKRYDDFNRSTASFAASYDAQLPAIMSAVRFEHFFNRFDPFTNALVLYIVAFVLVALSWLGWSIPFRRAAVSVLALALIVHTFGLGARIYISGRPPVTNLASSALFIAWGAVLLAMALEFVFRDGIGAVCAALIGFLSLLIGDRLALSGDTMKVLQAVLDTNFWLATHVIVINLGYAATFLAGILGVVAVLKNLLPRPVVVPSREAEARGAPTTKDLTRMIYGITCFAMTFSFIGTVLGGIWADQSWGRFWGWDPKENGAVLIVLANALLLHARWGGLVKDRGVACLAIFGNIVTAWSWFGTNMLGVGLHSYGFMESALQWLLAFVVSQVVLIVLANLPFIARARSEVNTQPSMNPKQAVEAGI